MSRPRPWVRLDVAFLDQDTIRELGERFGAAGPLAVVALATDAGAAFASKTSDFDVVEGRYAALARRVYADQDTVKAIERAMVELGLVEVVEANAVRFKVRLLKFHKWNAKDPNAATRKRRSRG